ENGLLTRQSQVLDAHCLACRMSAQEPDGLTATHFGNHNPPREPLTEHSSAFPRLGAAQQAEFFGNAQAAMLAQIRLERAAMGVAKAGSADDPIRQAALRQVRASARISPQRVAIEGAGCIEYELLLECQPIPPTPTCHGRCSSLFWR